MVGDDLLDDGEADAGADFTGLFGAFGAIELLADLFQLFSSPLVIQSMLVQDKF